MKKTLAIVITLALVLGGTAGPTALAATNPKVFAFDFVESDVLSICYHTPHSGYIPPERMVMIVLNNGADSANLYGGTLQFDKTVKFKKTPQVFGDSFIPNGTIAGLIGDGKSYILAYPTNIKTWDDFRKHVIGLPEGVANSPEPPTEWPLATRTNIIEAESPYDAGQTILAELKEVLPELEIAISKEVANNSVRYTASLKANKVAFGLVVYGSNEEGFNTFFVREIGKIKGFWSGYIGGVTEIVEYVAQKTNPTKK